MVSASRVARRHARHQRRWFQRLVPQSLTSRVILVFLVPTLVLGAFAAGEVRHLRSTARDAEVMHHSVELLQVAQRLSVPLVVEHGAAYALIAAEQEGVSNRLGELLSGPNTVRTIATARVMLDAALHDLGEQFSEFELADGSTIGERVAAASAALDAARAAFDDRAAVDIEQSYGLVALLALDIDATTDRAMAGAASTPELAQANSQVQTFEAAMQWGATMLGPIVDSAIYGNAGDALTREVAASGAFTAALTHLRGILPADRAAELDALTTSESFVTAGAVESAWVSSVGAAGPGFESIAASPAAVDAIGRLYEARANALLELYAYGERFLGEQAGLAGELSSGESDQERVALIWIWVAAGGSILLLGLVLTSTLLPLRALDRHTRLVREGDLAIDPTRPSGPSDIRSLTTTFNEMIVTLRAFDAQVGRLARGDTAIDDSLPGPLGATMRESVRRLAEVTDQLHRSEAAASLQARTDALTGLANRTAVLEHLEAMAATARATGRPGAIVYLDLDGFKNVNDTHGHAAGDRILRDIGERLRQACPNDEVARMGGDEFIVLLDQADGIERVAAFAARLIRLVEEPCEARDAQTFSLTASAGITLCDGTCSPLEAVARADSAVYRAKEKGRSRVECFDEQLAAELEAHSEMALVMRHGLDSGEFTLVFQPIVELATLRPVAVETLLRWTLADGRSVGPAEFIPIAERSGVISAIDDWVIDHALAVRRQWAADPITSDIRVGVNISGRHLSDSSLAARLAERCAAFGVDPASMGVEITETYLMENAARSRVVVDALRALGVGVAIDDFGTGYSSMSSLHELDADTIKIDQTFVEGLTRSSTDRTIVELVMRLADSLGMKVVAEGVDTQEKLDHLVSLGCRYAQGFHLAMPMDLDTCTTWLHERLGSLATPA